MFNIILFLRNLKQETCNGETKISSFLTKSLNQLYFLNTIKNQLRDL